MNAVQQQLEQHGGAYGAAGTGGGLAWFVAAADPLMKLISFSLGTTVAVLTIVWLVKKIRGTAKSD